MTHLDDMIDKLLTPEGKIQASSRLSNKDIDVYQIQSSTSRAEYFMQTAQSYGSEKDDNNRQLNLKLAMKAYEQAGVFSQAQNVARMLGDTEMEKVYQDILEHVR
jgi:hypothetical protein